jgi:hypothetical protein
MENCNMALWQTIESLLKRFIYFLRFFKRRHFRKSGNGHEYHSKPAQGRRVKKMGLVEVLEFTSDGANPGLEAIDQDHKCVGAKEPGYDFLVVFKVFIVSVFQLLVYGLQFDEQ